MTKASTNAVLRAAAKVLAWELYAAAGYCRTRASVNVEKFERELFVDDSDDETRIVFGRLDSQPIVCTALRLGQELAISYDLIREHRTSHSAS